VQRSSGFGANDQALYNIHLLAACQYFSIPFDVTNPKVNTVSVIARKSISVFPKCNSEMNIFKYNVIRSKPRDDFITDRKVYDFLLSLHTWVAAYALSVHEL
jgi:hypothetical protein